MTVKPADRPLQSLREATIDQLVMNYGHGKLSMEAFDRRIDQALDAIEHNQLLSLTEDLELSVDQGYLAKKDVELDRAISQQEDVEDAEDVEYMFNIFGGSNRRGEWAVGKEFRMINVCGGGEIDLTDAEFSAPVTRIKLYCVMGGATIYVPEGIRVKSKVFSFMGGFDDRSQSSSQADSPTLIIEGIMFMGGADVKVKKTYKQRLMEFGKRVRSIYQPETLVR